MLVLAQGEVVCHRVVRYGLENDWRLRLYGDRGLVLLVDVVGELELTRGLGWGGGGGLVPWAAAVATALGKNINSSSWFYYY